MKRTFLIIICTIATFALGYTAYAATAKNLAQKVLSKDPKDVQERITNLRNQQIKNFNDKNAQLLVFG
jgi:phosphoribosylcarboxyaminoimidazole (NCAIR) mutase